MTARSQAGNGIFSVNKVDVPFLTPNADARLSCVVSPKREISFEGPLTCMEEVVTGLSKQPENTFVALCEQAVPEIRLYSLDSLLSNEKNSLVKPRLSLNCEGREATVLRSRREEVLAGTSDGAVLLFSLKGEEKCERTFLYHRESINDICWLSQNERNEEKILVSASASNFLYM
jgi:WD40 repeat protein